MPLGVARGANNVVLLILDRPVSLMQIQHEVHQRITLGVAGALTQTDFLEGVCRQTHHLAQHDVRRHTVVATGPLADQQLDGFQVLFAQATGRECRFGIQHCRQKRRIQMTDCCEQIRHGAACDFLDFGIGNGGCTGGGGNSWNSDTAHGGNPSAVVRSRHFRPSL
ncbi:hypothetical protein D3C87_1462160 [compost metagenome]